jgi:hypothetical protein
MNSRHASLILMAINLGLVGTILYLVYALRFSPSMANAPIRTKVITNTVTQIAVRKINATNNLLASIGSRLINWRALESTNYVTYIENLRTFGCPEETIRDIIITDIAKVYARRRAELRNQLQPYRFWQTTDPLTGGLASSPELQQQFYLLEKDQRQLIRDLLGVDYRKELAKLTSDEVSAEQMNAFLTPEKQDMTRSVEDKYGDLEQEVYARSRGLFLADDQEQLRQIQRDKRAELATVLSPEELEEYDLRHSETANNMRTQLAGFQPTEEEFRKLFRLQKAFDDNFDQALDARDESGLSLKARAQQDAQVALSEEIKKVLGPERFTEFERVQDTDYRALLQISERFTLNPDVAGRVYNMKLAAEQYKAQVEASPNLTDEQRAIAIAAIARETERQVAASMGDQVFKTYQTAGGQWLGNLQNVDDNNLPPPSQEQPPQQPTGTTLPYDIRLLPPELQYYLLNPPRPLQPAK